MFLPLISVCLSFTLITTVLSEGQPKLPSSTGKPPVEGSEALHNQISHALSTLNLCCDRNLLETQESCSPSIENDLQKLKSLFGDKLSCQNIHLESKQVYLNLSDHRESTELFEYDSQGTIGIEDIIHSKDSYCVYKYNPNLAFHPSPRNLSLPLTMLICSPECSSTHPCYKKCCGWGESITRNEMGAISCKPYHFSTNFTSLWASKASTDSYESVSILPKFDLYHFYSVIERCHNPRNRPSRMFKIPKDGNILIEGDIDSVVPLEHYCVEEIVDAKETTSSLRVLFCNSEFVKHRWTPSVLQLTYCVISCVFIALAIIVYVIMRDQHGIMGWLQFAFLVSAFLYYCVRAIRLSVELHHEFKTEGGSLATIDLFFTLGLLTNIISLNAHLLWTFLKVKPERKANSWESLKPLVYSVVGCWSFTLLLVLVDVTIYAHNNDADEALHKSKIGIYLFLLVVTLLLAVGSGILLWRRLQDTSSIANGGFNPTQMLHLFLRLFCVTGFIWTLKILERVVKQGEMERGWFWDLVQFLTYINGVVLFFAFVCNRRTLQGLRKKFPQRAHLVKIRKRRDAQSTCGGDASAISEVTEIK